MKWTILKVLTHSGFGTRKEVTALIRKNKVSIDGESVSNEKTIVLRPEERAYLIDGEDFSFREKLYYALNKPAGYECSHKPSHHMSVFDLLPERLLKRGMEACGRLDVDTTGILLFTDDGQFNRKIMSPKSKLPKTYHVITKHLIDEDFRIKLEQGVKLKDEPDKLVLAEKVEFLSDKELVIVISEGKYHQVKRMIAAAGNRVEQLHRSAIGSLSLQDLGISEGAGTLISDETLKMLNS